MANSRRRLGTGLEPTILRLETRGAHSIDTDLLAFPGHASSSLSRGTGCGGKRDGFAVGELLASPKR